MMRAGIVTDPGEWDAFVQAAPDATFYHAWTWRTVIEESYGHRAHALGVWKDDRLCAVLPLVEMKSVLFGHFLVSLPYFNYGGVLGEDAEARKRALEEAGRLAQSIGAGHVEVRQGRALETEWASISAKSAMIVRLDKPKKDYLAGLSSRLRNKINRSRKCFEVKWGGLEDAEEFYQVFAVNMRDLGTPVYPQRWFENVLRRFPEQTRLLTLWENGAPVAGTLVAQHRRDVELPWIASTPEPRRRYSTVLLYWTALEWAMEEGFASVDLGRCTPGSGTHQFKQQWNPEEVPLRWYYWLPQGKPIPEIRPSNPKYRLAIEVWKRLPLAVANRLGPRIVRSIP